MIKFISTFLVIFLLSFSTEAEEKPLVSKYDNNVEDIVLYPGPYYKDLQDIIKIHGYVQTNNKEEGKAYLQYLIDEEKVVGWLGYSQLVKLEMVNILKGLGEVEVWAVWINLQDRKLDKRYYIPILAAPEQKIKFRIENI